MKKCVAFLTAFVMMFSSVFALADEFSIRNGITFGMTVDEVNALEDTTLEAVEESVAGIGTLIDGYDAYEDYGYLAGYSCSFTYLFSQISGGLDSIVYDIYESCDSKQEHSDVYSGQIADIDAILTEKYDAVSLGAFDELESPACRAVISDANENSRWNDVKVDGKMYLVKYDDYYVTVEHLIYETVYTDDVYAAFLGYSTIKEFIIYTRVSDGYVNAVLESAEAKQSDIEASIQNDF